MNVTSWMVHTCTKKSRTGTGTKGDPVFGSPATFKARVEKARATSRFAGGRESQHTYVLVTETQILPDDVVWFPSISGEPADDTSNLSAGRTPQTVETATTKPGAQKLFQVFF